MEDKDLVTGTPVTKKPFNYHLFFEWVKLVQRVIMVILTIGVLITMIHVGNKIDRMRMELNEAGVTINAMKDKISDLTTEISKGFKIRLW